MEAENVEIKKTLEVLLKRTNTHIDSEDETDDPTTKTNVQFFRR